MISKETVSGSNSQTIWSGSDHQVRQSLVGPEVISWSSSDHQVRQTSVGPEVINWSSSDHQVRQTEPINMILEIFLVLFVVAIWRHYQNRPKNLPPGPPTFPFIGTVVMPAYLESARGYRKKYGDIFRCEIGPFKMIYICDFKMVKEMLSKTEVSDRPRSEGFHYLSDGVETGIVLSNGLKWQNARRFLLRNLRDLGMGKSYLDEAIIQEAKFLVEDFKSITGKPMPFPDSLNIAVLNIVWQMVASHRYDLHDEDVKGFMKHLKTIGEDSLGLFILALFPGIKKIIPKPVLDTILRLKRVNLAIDSAKKIFTDIVDRRKGELDPENPKNVIDEYLVQMQQKTDVAQFFSELDLMRTSFDLFAAGFDTTSNTLRWMCLYAAKYPVIQVRIQRQIDAVLSRDQFPGNQHKTQLPLVEAFIHEVLRCSSLIPLGAFRCNSIDVQLGGYNIPKGSFIFGTFGLCHEDPKYWEKPNEFSIDRFLDEEGRFVSHKEGFLPFGIGKRVCIGESLARMELSIFTAALLQNFSFSPPEGREVDLTPSLVPLASYSKEQDIIITIRK